VKILLYLFLITEVIAACAWYVTSPHGYAAYAHAYQVYQELNTSIQHVVQEVAHLENVYVAWEQDPFWYEQYARNHLQMGYPDETVYLLDT